MENHTQYQELDSNKISETTLALVHRVEERFPNSGLLNLSQKLLEVCRRAHTQSEWIIKPIIGLRVIIVLLIIFIGLALGGTLHSMNGPTKPISFFEFIQVLEAGINDVVLIGLAVFFLTTLEKRFKSHRALKSLHELRAIAHIIDMHQLTKDPDRLHWEAKGAIQPRKNLSPLQLARYLDYCSEMLSLVGKIAVLYVQKFDDTVALSTVNDIENLTNGLSRKIWQKLIILHGSNTIMSEDLSQKM